MNLNINKLRNEVEERENKKYKTFETILEMCYKKILNINKQNNDYNCTFIVPNVVFGLPLYNVGECVRFIMDKLVEKGFEIYFAPPTTINIYWTPKNYNKSKVYNTHNITPTLTNIPNSNQVVDYYNSIQPQNQLMIKYTGHGNGQMNENDDNYNDTQNYKSVKTKKSNPKNIDYKPIDDYKNTHNSIYDSDDLELFQNKIDNLI